MKKIYTLLILLFFGIYVVQAQTPTLSAYQKSAKEAIEDEDFYSAWKYYTIALKIDSTRMENIYNLAESARQFKSYEVAKEAYQKVLESESKAEYPLAEYWLADVYRSQALSDLNNYNSENYDKAITHYQNFLGGQITPKGPSVNPLEFYGAKARKAVEDCMWAKNEMQRPRTGYNIKPFGNGVNTPGTEFAPLEHKNQVYYSALEYDKENFCPDPNSDVTRLYTSTQVDGGQPSAINWAKEKKGKFVAHTTFNNDGSRMYFTECERLNASEFDCDIFYRQKNESGLWGDAIRLPDHVNRVGTTSTQPNVGYDNDSKKELLFFVTNRADSVGGANADMNIYCSIIEADGQVGVPSKLNINTPTDDVTPFFNKKENQLYFSSKGHQGFGGFDIFKSKKTGSTYTQPVAMKAPLNSSYDDLYFSTDENFENAYFSTNRLGVTYEEEGMETCCNDIYKLEMILVNLEVLTFNSLGNRLALDSCEVALVDMLTGEVIEKKFNPESNDYYFPLELERDYKITGNRSELDILFDRWTTDDTLVTTRGIRETTTLKRELELTPNVDLVTLTFNKKTEAPLPGCTFNFYDDATGELILTTDRLDDNRFESALDFGKNYKVVASKEGYTSDSVSFNTRNLLTPKSFEFPLRLEPNEEPCVPVGLSVILFFDNDEPDKDTYRKTTQLDYKQSYDEYIKAERIEKFINENGKGLSGEAKIKEEERTQKFFDDEVVLGMTKLDLFARFLERHLPQGRSYQIEVEGFASPRAPSRYNMNLTSRRVSSVENYLRRYNNGVLAPYIGATNKLRIKLIPRGEDPSQGKSIPSKYADPKSIYSIEASQQRKVEIVRVRRIDGDCDPNKGKTYTATPIPTPPSSVRAVDVSANTYDRISRANLTGCKFRFIDESTGAVILETENISDNSFYSSLEFGKRYRLIATKEGYTSDEVSFSTKGLVSSRTFKFPLYLEPSSSGANLPVILYFDNDEPDKRTRATTTNKSYQETYERYSQPSRVQEFVNKNGENLSGEMKLKAEEETRVFFTGRVQEGMERLEMLAQFLERSLPLGKKYQIELEGFASPRAPSEYNQKLTSRRVSSVENYLKRYNGGVLSKYIGYNKSLRITLVPRGENPASGLGIPSNYSDPKSIYSIEASEQRKVTIIRLKSFE